VRISAQGLNEFMLLNDNIARRVNISGAIKRAAKRELSSAVGRSAQRGGLRKNQPERSDQLD